uniref:Aspartate beta-hydroxylase n=1 Tax=Spermophilus dauricus TaxID=99837 RepID=A0A8C9PME5_SPEDA
MAEDKETKHGGHKNGRKGGLSGSSFFTWFMVIALLGVWTSVAVVWFDLVDYEEVLGKLGVYDADGDGDFDVDDAKVLLGPATDGPAEELPLEYENFFTDDADDTFEMLEPETLHEVAEDSYLVEEPVLQDHHQDIEEVIYDQENPDDVTYQDYDKQEYEPSENDAIEISDNVVEESNTIPEEVSVPATEEQQEVPPDT